MNSIIITIGLVFTMSVMSAINPNYSNTGLLTTGDKAITFWNESILYPITALDWENYSYTNQMKTKYVWMEIVGGGAFVHYHSDNPYYINYEFFYETSPFHWARWHNNSYLYVTKDWTYCMIRCTVLPSAPGGNFSFFSYFASS